MISGNAPVMFEEESPELVYMPTVFVIPDVGATALEIVCYPTDEDGELLVICYDGFMDYPHLFLSLKSIIGFS